MAKRRRDRWLLARVAAQNVGHSRVRAIFLGAAVMLAVGVSFASFVTGWALRAGMATSLSRMGADLIVVPRSTLVNITSSLLTVQPTEASLDAGMAKSLAAIPGVATAAPQRIVLSQIDEHPANLIAFDPAIDFSILPWLGEHLPGPLTADHVIAGGRVKVRVGDALRLCGKPFVVHGRLEQTGVGPFDQSYFLSLEALAALSAIIRKSGVQNGQSPAASANAADGLAAPDPVDRLKAGETNACGADISVDRVSAFLLRLSPDAKLQDVKFAIAQLPGVRIVEGNSPPRAKR